MKSFGLIGWEAEPSFLPTAVPRLLDALAANTLDATFFLVGRDIERLEDRLLLSRIRHAGHRFGNHTYSHSLALADFAPDAIEHEVAACEEALWTTVGIRPHGFRAPGYGWSPTLIAVLAARRYSYDASVWPTRWARPIRGFYFLTAGMGAAARHDRRHLFRGAKGTLLPNRPFAWRVGQTATILELPVTVSPWLRAPLHASFLLYLASYSETAMFAYLHAALAVCAMESTPFYFLLHPLDVIGGDEASSLRRYPGMRLTGKRKTAILRRILSIVRARCDVVTEEQYCELTAKHPRIASIAITRG
ncbi:MAG: polysaccharide deacetylase family protein [Gemmatimonadaceae bacterium]